MDKKIIVIMALVFSLTVIYAIHIFIQLGRFQKKALEAKQKKEAFLAEMAGKRKIAAETPDEDKQNISQKEEQGYEENDDKEKHPN